MSEQDYVGTTWKARHSSKMIVERVTNGRAFCRHIGGKREKLNQFELPIALLIRNRFGWRMEK